MPSSLTLKARLGWKYYFESGWAVVKTDEGCFIVTDEGCDLDTATIFQDEESLIFWLGRAVDSHIEDDAVFFFRQFCSVSELIDDEVAKMMISILSQ